MKHMSFLKHVPTWVATLMVAAAASLTAAEADDGFKDIFNGKTLEGWDGDPSFWSVRDGAITGQSTEQTPVKNNTFIIWRQGTVEDFELRLTYRVVGNNPEKWANSGIQYRSKDFGKWVVGGYQADIEGGPTYTGILYEERMRGILAERGQKVQIETDGKLTVQGSTGDSAAIQARIKDSDWNDYVIRAEGNHLVEMVNGSVTVDVTDLQADKRSMSGIVALQMHVGKPMTVQFKNIKLKRLKPAQAKRIVLVAGPTSHGPGEHETFAGLSLLKKCLDHTGLAQTTVYAGGWPKDPTAFDAADAVTFFMDGGDGNALIQGDHLQILDGLMKKGVGFGCMHYVVEVPAKKGGPEMIRWLGGYYETGYSTNPSWDAAITFNTNHEVCRGLTKATVMDEWYYNIRFDPAMTGITPLMTATPPDNTRGTDAARKNPGRAETISWVKVREDGGRSFGWTGGHYHKNWANNDYRKYILNAMLWIAHGTVPQNGIESTVTPEDLSANLDRK
jgi:type 1 glutamine amidotransferase